MGFLDYIKCCFREGEIPIEPVYRAVIFGDGAVFIENAKSIFQYTKEEIILSLKKGVLIIKGSDLYIKKYCAGDVVICGNISGIERA